MKHLYSFAAGFVLAALSSGVYMQYGRPCMPPVNVLKSSQPQMSQEQAASSSAEGPTTGLRGGSPQRSDPPAHVSASSDNVAVGSDVTRTRRTGRTLLFVGDSVDLMMMKAVFPQCPVDAEHMDWMDCYDAVTGTRNLFIHNRFDVSLAGPDHSSDLSSLAEVVKEPVDELWLGANFGYLARLKELDPTRLRSMDETSEVADSFATNLGMLMKSLEQMVPSRRYGWMERFPARETSERNNFWYGNRISQLNTAGTKVAVASGWRAFRTLQRKVALRDEIYPADEALVSVFRTLAGHFIDDQSHTPSNRPHPLTDPRDKVMANYPVQRCRGQDGGAGQGYGQLVMAQDLRGQTDWGLFHMRNPKYVCEVAGLGKTRPCVVYSFGSFNEISFEVGMDVLAPQCDLHTFDPGKLPEAASQARYNFSAHHVGIGNKDSKGSWSLPTIMRMFGHKHVDVFKIDIEGGETSIMPHLRQEGFLEIIDQLQIEFHSVKGLQDGLKLLYDAGFVMTFARREDRCPSCTEVAMQRK